MEKYEPQKLEGTTLKFWGENRIFEKSISQRKGKPPFSFYDGPPFATGKPHYGHILATTIKDTVLRYFTMRGYQAPRRVGWDCHGLPIENLIEKELGIKNKKEIEEYGIEKFNVACRASVFRCVDDFEKILKRVGRWADYKDTYATLDQDYIESVWWVFKQLWDLGLVYKDYRVIPYCPRCGTPLSNFEANQGYKETKDPSIFVRFSIKGQPRTYFLVFTTAPWTLPSNVALAVHPEATYILVKHRKENYILAKERREILEGEYQIIKNFLGKELVNLKYQPFFNYLTEKKDLENIQNAFRVLPGDFVSLEEGTGIVHIATMYGDEDFRLGRKFNLPIHHLVDRNGCFEKKVDKFAGQFVKNADFPIIKDLQERNLLYKKEEISHSYPFCWRCETPLLYYALETWYIAVSKIKKNLIENNKKIRWVPAHIKSGRFGKWLKGAKDWAFSRNRFWGAPIPIWKCRKCGGYKCLGGIKELGRKIKDLHRPYIDKIELKCKCGGKMKRIEEVFDCWFESGSMPYAQWHYPFENKSLVEKTFPADFVAEGLDQTRGWFYTLHVLASALTLENRGLGKNKSAFKNAIVNGMILDSEGRKLSKRLKNYPETAEIFEKYGADSLRYFLLSSTPIGEDYLFSGKGVEGVYRNVVLTLWHSYSFFITYKDRNFRPKANFKVNDKLNKWILSRINAMNKEVVFWMDRYELTKGSRPITKFIDDLSNWYIRRSRRKFQNPAGEKEIEEASQVLYQCLMTLSKIAAPFIPFISEYIYRDLKKEKDPESIHLSDYPRVKVKLIDKNLEEKMTKIREIAAQVLAERVKAGIKVRQPLASLKIKNQETKTKDKELLELIKEEVNVKEIIFDPQLKNEVELDTEITPELKEEGIIREIIRHIQEMRKKAGLKPKDQILVRYSTDSELDKILIKNRILISKEAKIKSLVPTKKTKETFGAEKEVNIGRQSLWLAIKKL